MRIILLGCPGAGKGTQAKQISHRYHIPQISTGDILRQAIQENSELGKKVKALVDHGHYVPDELMIELVRERIQQPDCQQGFLLDGFPRTIAQANALQSMTNIDYVFDIDVSKEEVVKRLSGRRIHPGSGRTYHIHYQPPQVADKDDITGEALIQRPDDSEETVRERLSVYQNQTLPLREFYQQEKNYIKINGENSVEKISQEIFNILNHHQGRVSVS